MNHPVRAYIFRHYWWITPLVATLIAIAVIVISRPDNVPGNLVTVCVGALGVIYFVQKQKVDDLQLFERLFTQFNDRYSAIHSDLVRVSNGPVGLHTNEIEIFDKYFNLCAEEYLFYLEGRILPSVWKSWCLGMLDHLNHDRVKKYWEKEESKENNSYYGLTTKEILKGAGK